MNEKIKEFLKQLEVDSGKFNNIDEATAGILSNIIHELKLKLVLEIGTSNGYSTIWFADATEKVVTYEINEERYELAKDNFEKLNLSNIELIKGDILDVFKEIEDIDFVFIDAKKADYLKYLKHIFNHSRNLTLMT